MINVGLIGFGLAGKVFHAPLIEATSGLHLHTIVTRQEQTVSENYPKAKVITKVEAIFQDPNIQLIVVATPNESHYPLAKAAIMAKKHVVVDKPFVIYTQDGVELKKLSEKNQVIGSVFHNRRWDNDFLTLQQVVSEGHLGEIHTFHSHFHRYQPKPSDGWRIENNPGAGILYDLGSHLIDQALTLFGKPDTVYAELLNLADEKQIHAPDYFHIVLGYGKKRRVFLQASTLIRKAGPRYEVHGSTGSFFKSGMDVQETALKKGLRPDSSSWGMEQPEFYATLYTDGYNAGVRIPTIPGKYEEYYRQLQEAIAGKEPVPVSLDEGIQVVQLIEAAIKSNQAQKTIKLK